MARAAAPHDILSRDPAFHTSIFILHADWFCPASGSSGKRLQLPTSLSRVGQHPSSLSSPRLATSSPRSPCAPPGNHALTPKRPANTPARTTEACLQLLTLTPADMIFYFNSYDACSPANIALLVSSSAACPRPRVKVRNRWGASLPRPNTSKSLNVQTLIATLRIGISLFTNLTKGRSIQITGSPYLSILDTQHDHANVGQTLPCI